ncbi:MAG: type II CRISPR-associated endonuclease Cas1 [Bdellovibrionota bacterium]
MAWRIVAIENEARLSLKDKQLHIKQGEVDCTIPLEDISTIIIDNQRVLLTTALLQGVVAADAAVIICDKKHTPCGVYLPFNQHSRCSEVFQKQLSQSEPFKKRCWQAVVKQKILNQAFALKILKREGFSEVKSRIERVQSGDSSNVEAQAARLYWNYLFDKSFRRMADNNVNAALNYGYAIVRSTVARALAGRGLYPQIGIHHDNKLNGFNLADDFVEPFRAVVDVEVAKLMAGQGSEFTREVRIALVSLLNEQCLINGESVNIPRAAEVMASSYVNAMTAGDYSKLLLPKLGVR